MSMTDILDLLDGHSGHRETAVNLVASENLLSPAAQRALASDMTHRYCIPPVDKRPATIWDYPNQQWVREMQEVAERLTCSVFGAAAADVRPLSGNNAAYVLIKALVGSGEQIASVPAGAGGHFATAAICDQEGIQRFDLPYDEANGVVDVAGAASLCVRNGVKLVFLDASMQLFPHPVKELRDALPADVVIAYDASHTMGLIAGGEFQNPLGEGADLLQGSTHKTFFGPQKALFAFRRDDAVAAAIQQAVSPLFVSNTHPHHTAALAVALQEFLDFGTHYASRVVLNAQAMASRLHGAGENLLYPELGFTRCHQLFWVCGTRSAAERRWEALEEIGVHVNLVRVPFRRDTFGFRVGVAEATRRGMGEDEMRLLADLMVAAVRAPAEAVSLRRSVAQLSAAYPRVYFGYDVDGTPMRPGTGE